MRLLRYEPLDSFVVAGELHELKDPTGKPTPRQWHALNALGCIVIVEPGQATPLDCRHAAGAISAALALVDGGASEEPARVAIPGPPPREINSAGYRRREPEPDLDGGKSDLTQGYPAAATLGKAPPT